KLGLSDSFETYYPIDPINSTGYIIYEMANDTTHWCKGWTGLTGTFYLGQNYWKGGIESASCYKDNVTEPSPYSAIPFWLMGSLYADMITPDTTANYSREDTVPAANYTIAFNGTSTDDCGYYKQIADFPVSYTAEHESYSNEFAVTTPTGIYYTYDWNPDGSAPYGWYNVTILAYTAGTYTDDYWNGSFFLENAFFLASIPDLTAIDIEPGTSGCWGQSPFNFTVNTSDDDNNTVNVTMYLNSTYTGGTWELYNYSICTDCNRTQPITFSRNFTCGERGTWDVMFMAGDSAGFSYNVTEQFEVNKENITINVTGGNGTAINRSAARPNNEVQLSFQIWDTIKNQTTVALSNATEVFTRIERDTDDWQTVNEINNTTHYYYDFNASCSYVPGQRNWKVNVSSACYIDYETENFPITIFGDVI
ncbi:MAG: hypothetical protein KAT35_05915, partial [Candidatus Aenigmarchaeota archaeon]|nr:hypothetical protein [Candidatus Aenigmarchaeota archaeon]